MKKTTSLLAVFLMLAGAAFTQTDTAQKKSLSVFEKITTGVKDYKPDTTAAPDDKLTRKIIELRNARGGFNINEALEYKLEEERQKGEMPKEEIDKAAAFFKTGMGKQWLDNAVINMYRQQFTYSEVKQLVKFYKSAAGQKLADAFPLIMVQSLAAAEMIKEVYVKQQKK